MQPKIISSIFIRLALLVSLAVMGANALRLSANPPEFAGASGPLDTAVTWLSSSAMRCPEGIVSRGAVSTCVAIVDYLNDSYVVPPAELQVRHDACTHGALLCSNPTPSGVTNVDCSSAANVTVCEYSIPFSIPSDYKTGGVYTVSLARIGSDRPKDGVRYPETLIVQGTLTCGARGRADLRVGAMVALAVMVAALLWA